MERLVDLTMLLSAQTIPVPGHPSPRFEPLHSLHTDGVSNTVATLSLHTATHIDAPSHFIEDGETIDMLGVERFHRPGIRLDLSDVRPREAIDLARIEAAGFDAVATRDKILLLATGWTDRASATTQLYSDNPFLADDAAHAIAEAEPSAIGVDFAVDGGKPWPNHSILLGHGIPLIENLVGLTSLPGDGFEIWAFPLRIAAENGAPARVVAAFS